jgi:antitoxin component YwqK of YwqJK toxin-antitoxin module
MEIGICDLPTEVMLRLVEYIDGINYLSFIIAFGSYELFVSTRDGNRKRFLKTCVRVTSSCKEEYNIRRDTFQRHGKSTIYIINLYEQIHSIAHYRNGFRHGYCADFAIASEILKFETWYHHGSLNGRSIYYYPNGKIRREEEKIGGRNNGPLIEYHENGIEKIVATYKNNCPHGKYLKYTNKGELYAERNYVNGVRNGIQIKYHIGCQQKIIWKKTMYKNGVLHDN